MSSRVLAPELSTEESNFDNNLRPQKLSEYVGQQKVKDNLCVFLEASQKRQLPLEHVLLYGPPGLGKTTLAHIIATEMGSNIRITSGPAIERAGDLGAILTSLKDGDILFIDEIHRLNKTVEEVLYPAMEDYVLDIVIGKGAGAKTVRLDLPHFTLIGATTRMSLISSPLRDRFGNVFHLNFYEDSEIQQILHRSARIFDIPLDENAGKRIAQCSRSTPRIANRLLRRVRDYAEVRADGIITPKIAHQALSLLEIDEHGLDMIDRRILEIIIDKFSGGPVGLGTLSAASSEEQETIEEVYEPFLLQKGFIARTPRGRVATENAYKHLNYELPTT